MGKSSSKFSAESFERLRFGGSATSQSGAGERNGGASRSQLSSLSGATPSHNDQQLQQQQQHQNQSVEDTQLTKDSGSNMEAQNNSIKHQPLTKGHSQDAQSLAGSLVFDAQFLNGILDDEKAFVDYLEEVFCKEVEMSDGIQTLFRGNCMASKIMSHCFRTFGANYIKQLLGPHIKAQSIVSYEIDSTRLEESGDIDVNQANLLRLTKQILDSILASAEQFPAQLNLVCSCLRKVICKKYPNSNIYLKAVGTVIFLRFINPAIVSPYEAGIVEQQPPPKTMRGLMLVSKILQNIANNVEFSKEEHMLPFNDFVRTQFDPLREWVSKISTERNHDES